MHIGLYVIGDEILSGKRQDKHLANVSELLKERGLQLSWVKFLGDDLDILINEFKQSFSADSLVFSCGGIGGTPDDLTRLAVAKALDTVTEIHAQGLQLLYDHIEQFNGGITEQRKRMVEFPKGARLIPNPINHVPGFSMQQHYFVPGFPKMAKPMIEWVLESHYADLYDKNYVEWSLKLHEVPESHIADLMTELQDNYQVKVFSLPRFVDDSYQIELGLKGHKDKVSAARDKLQTVIKERGYKNSSLENS